MTSVIFALLTATLAGSFVWLLQICARPFTQKLFSQTWHYYSGLIPVFFLLGGTEGINRALSRVRAMLPDARLQPADGSAVEWAGAVVSAEKGPATAASFLQSLLDALLQLEHRPRLAAAAIIVWVVGMAAFLALNVYRYWVFKRSIQVDKVEKNESILRIAQAGCQVGFDWLPVDIHAVAKRNTPWRVDRFGHRRYTFPIFGSCFLKGENPLKKGWIALGLLLALAACAAKPGMNSGAAGPEYIEESGYRGDELEIIRLVNQRMQYMYEEDEEKYMALFQPGSPISGLAGHRLKTVKLLDEIRIQEQKNWFVAVVHAEDVVTTGESFSNHYVFVKAKTGDSGWKIADID
ncbi:hypothetical protein [Cohnella hongkongensis]|uniref:DUF4829 domain-containing protein n=1 Tax=Cohnella hongkongensis TaxID=178337 RepID=A0ABV9FFQ8_9BACL